MRLDVGEMSESLCDYCKYGDKDSNEKPCNTCVQWTEGELDYTKYEPKEGT